MVGELVIKRELVAVLIIELVLAVLEVGVLLMVGLDLEVTSVSQLEARTLLAVFMVGL